MGALGPQQQAPDCNGHSDLNSKRQIGDQTATPSKFQNSFPDRRQDARPSERLDWDQERGIGEHQNSKFQFQIKVRPDWRSSARPNSIPDRRPETARLSIIPNFDPRSETRLSTPPKNSNQTGDRAETEQKIPSRASPDHKPETKWIGDCRREQKRFKPCLKHCGASPFFPLR